MPPWPRKRRAAVLSPSRERPWRSQNGLVGARQGTTRSCVVDWLHVAIVVRAWESGGLGAAGAEKGAQALTRPASSMLEGPLYPYDQPDQPDHRRRSTDEMGVVAHESVVGLQTNLPTPRPSVPEKFADNEGPGSVRQL